MSIRNAREAQERQIEERHNKEAEARPDAMHRAVVFLLRQAALNNRDTSPEVKHHIETLDREMANEEVLSEVEPASPAPAADPHPPTAGETREPAAPIKVSKRFRRSNA